MPAETTSKQALFKRNPVISPMDYPETQEDKKMNKQKDPKKPNGQFYANSTQKY